MSFMRPLTATLIASAVLALVGVTTSVPASAASLERDYARTHRNHETPKPYCWTERKRVMVKTHHGWRWEVRRIRTCR